MSFMQYNGGAFVAMKGDQCVAIASDRRFGIEAQTISCDYEKIFQLTPVIYFCLPGLVTDSQTVEERIRFRKNMYELKEERHIAPKTFSSMLSNMLYENRFAPYLVEPMIAGLHPYSFEPFICTMDVIGCKQISDEYVVGGSCKQQLYAMCETVWEPDLKPDDLFETISQTLLNAFDRDAMSGWGAVVYVIEKDKITTKYLKTRMD